jgi:hypothetical protein
LSKAHLSSRKVDRGQSADPHGVFDQFRRVLMQSDADWFACRNIGL